jgi:hypothetical protein
LADLVNAAIDTASDEAAKPRLRRCLPALLSAIGVWGGSPTGELAMAAATPKAAFMFFADDWPDVPESDFRQHEVARALVAAIESSAHSKSDVILGATTLLLGAQGLAAQRAEQDRICQGRRGAICSDTGRARRQKRCADGDGDPDAAGDVALEKERPLTGLKGFRSSLQSKVTIARRLAPRNLKEHDMQPQPLVLTDDGIEPHLPSRDADRARPP